MEQAEGGSESGAVSIGEEDQLREIEMEHEQRQQDDGVPPRSSRRTVATARRKPAPPASEDENPWDGRADDPDHPGQTPQGGLGGSGPVQP